MKVSILGKKHWSPVQAIKPGGKNKGKFKTSVASEEQVLKVEEELTMNDAMGEDTEMEDPSHQNNIVPGKAKNKTQVR